jgi:hypothetical protein
MEDTNNIVTLEDGTRVNEETGEILPALDLSCVTDWDEEPEAPAPEGDLSTLAGCLALLNALCPAVVAAPPAYPFVGKKQVKARLTEDEDLRVVAFVTLFHLQTADEQAVRDTKDRNKRGFMSSHAWHGTRIAEELIASEGRLDVLAPEDQERVHKYAVSYSRQMANALRSYAIQQNPELGVSAGAFFGG